MGNNQARFPARDRTEMMETSDGEERNWTVAGTEEESRRSGMEGVSPDLMMNGSSRNHISPSRTNKSCKNSISSPSDTGNQSLDHLYGHTSEWEDGRYCDTSRIHRDIDMLFSYLDGWPDEPEDQENDNQPVKIKRFALDSLEETEEDQVDDNQPDLPDPIKSFPSTDHIGPSRKLQPANLSVENSISRENLVKTPFKEKVVALAALLEKRGKNSVVRQENLAEPLQTTSSPDDNFHDKSLPSLKRTRRSEVASREALMSTSPRLVVQEEPDRWHTFSGQSEPTQAETGNVTSTSRNGSHGTISSLKKQDLKKDRAWTATELHRRRIPPDVSTKNTLHKGDIVTALYSYTNKMPGTICFTRGQSGVVIRLNTGGWCYVSLRQCEGWTPANYWHPVRSAKDDADQHQAIWMLGFLDRLDTIFLLLHFGQDGDFLVRDSSTREGEFTLSVRHGQNVHHFAIKVNDQNKFIIGNLAFPFNQLADIVTHYQQHTILSETFAVLENAFSVRFV